MVPQVAHSAGIASGNATPSISLPASASTLTEFRSLSRRASGVGHSPLRMTMTGIPSLSGTSMMLDDSSAVAIPMASTSSSLQGLEVPTAQEEVRSPGSLTHIHEEGLRPHRYPNSLSVSTRFDEHGSGDSILNDTVPPTPTQSMRRRSSM